MDERSALKSTNFKIIVEANEVCITTTLSRAIACYLATFYVFHLSYIPSLEKTISFIQKFILGIQDGSTTAKPLLTLASRLSKMSKDE